MSTKLGTMGLKGFTEPTQVQAMVADTTRGKYNFAHPCTPVFVYNATGDPLKIKINSGVASATVYDYVVPNGECHEITKGMVAIRVFSMWTTGQSGVVKGTNWMVVGADPQYKARGSVADLAAD